MTLGFLYHNAGTVSVKIDLSKNKPHQTSHCGEEVNCPHKQLSWLEKVKSGFHTVLSMQVTESKRLCKSYQDKVNKRLHFCSV